MRIPVHFLPAGTIRRVECGGPDDPAYRIQRLAMMKPEPEPHDTDPGFDPLAYLLAFG